MFTLNTHECMARSDWTLREKGSLHLEEFTSWKYMVRVCTWKWRAYHTGVVRLRKVESQERNEQWPVRKHPLSSKHSYFCLIGVWVGGDQDKAKAWRERQGRFKIWRGERRTDMQWRWEQRNREVWGWDEVATTCMWERIIKIHVCLSAVKPLLPLLCWLPCQAGSSL